MKNIENLLDMSSSVELGDKEKIARQKKSGKLTARDRINLLLDEDSFIEIDKFAGKNNIESDKLIENNVIAGYGTVDERLVFLYAQDFTAQSGAMDKKHAQKIFKIQEMALKMGAPIVSFIDSAGGKIEDGIETIESFSKVLYQNTMLSGLVPQIAVVVGPSIGASSFSPALSDFVFMVDHVSFMSLNGASRVKGNDDEEITLESLGGAKANSEIIGSSDFISPSEEEAIAKLRNLLNLLPSNNVEGTPSYTSDDDINRTEEVLNEIIGDQDREYDVKDIIRAIADEGEIFEVKESFAKNIITAFIRLNGNTIGLVANQSNELDGMLNIGASDKAARFIRICDSFNIPLLTLVDSAGFIPSKEEEYNGAISHASKMVYAYAEATVPKVSLIVKKAYGSAYIAMGSKELGVDQAFAWPGAEISAIDPKAAANILYKEEIANSADPMKTREEKIQEYKKLQASPYKAAQKGYIDDIIFPSMSRPRLISAFDMLESKREDRPIKKHGNLPL